MSELEVKINLDLQFIANTLSEYNNQTSFWYDLVERFIRNQRSFDTQKAYMKDLMQFFKWLNGEGISSYQQVTVNKAIEYRDFLKSFGGRKIKGELCEATNRTVHRKISSLSSFFEFTSNEIYKKSHKIRPNPFRKIKRLKVDDSSTVTEALLKEELKLLMSHLDSLPPTLINLRDKAIIKTLFGVIIRNRAFIALKGRDFYLLGDRFKLKYVDKGEKVFDEAINSNTAQAIIDYLGAMKLEGREVLDNDPLFQPVHGKDTKKHFSVNQITNILRRHCKRAGIGDWVSVHSAKATVTSEIVEKYGVHIAQRKTKHTKSDQVLAYYGKRREREISPFDDLDYL